MSWLVADSRVLCCAVLCWSLTGSEAHGGSTYCALAALSLMKALPNATSSACQGGLDCLSSAETDAIMRWCVKR
jgi:prenyltransferase beta subunit